MRSPHLPVRLIVCARRRGLSRTARLEPGADMAKKLRPIMPVRVARLHGRLLISVALGAIVTLAVAPTDWRVPTKLLVGCDTGVLLYLGLVLQLVLTCGVREIKRRAAEDDEGAL